jgi:hypothetical protein
MRKVIYVDAVSCTSFFRFVTDYQIELYCRVEIQNRVYRREIAALDLEIGRLKRQLMESPNTSSDSTSDEAASKVSHKVLLVSTLFLLSGVCVCVCVCVCVRACVRA